MRNGINPNKFNTIKNVLKEHRIIMVVHIPNETDEYYRESNLVFQKSLSSLINSIDLNNTNITLINNYSCEETELIIQKYLKFIDKYVIYSENKGKVYALLNEVRGIYEPYVTLTDSDVIFSENWEKVVLEAIKQDANIGVITPIPMPQLSFYHNSNMVFNYIFRNEFIKTKIVSDAEFELMVKNFNKKVEHLRTKIDWLNIQFQYKNNPDLIAGSGHFCAIYRTDVLKKSNEFPSVKFKNGYEEFFIDKLVDMNGYYRLSTTKNFVYHMGNNFEKEFKFENQEFNEINKKQVSKKIVFPFIIRFFFSKIYLKLKFDNS